MSGDTESLTFEGLNNAGRLRFILADADGIEAFDGSTMYTIALKYGTYLRQELTRTAAIAWARNLLFDPLISPQKLAQFARNPKAVVREEDTALGTEPCIMVDVTNAQPDTTMPSWKNLDIRYFFSKGVGVLGYTVSYLMNGVPYERRSFLLSRCYSPISSFSIDSEISSIKKRLPNLREVSNVHMLSNDSASAVESNLLSENTIAPKFTGKSLSGETIDPTFVKGCAILLDFSYPNCAPCHLYLPLLHALYNAYSQKGLIIFGVDPVDADNTPLEKFHLEEKLPFDFLLTTKSVESLYGVSSYPTIYLLDSEGHIVFSGAGFSKANSMRLKAAVQLLMQEGN